MMAHLNTIVMVLCAVGAINWGLVGLLNLNVVAELGGLLGVRELFSRIVYVIIGVAGVLLLIQLIQPGLIL